MSGYGFWKDGKAFFPDGTSIDEDQGKTDLRNAALSGAEVEAFRSRASDRAFVYVDDPTNEIRTFMGERLGVVISWGRIYRCPNFGGFGSERQSIRIRGIDGRDWYGTYYRSSGDYARIKACKGTRNA